MIDLLTVYPKSETDQQRESDAALLAAHESDIDAHGLNTLRADISANGQAVAAATALLRSTFKNIFADTFDRVNAVGLGNGWTTQFSGSPNISGNAAASPQPGNAGVVYGVTRELSVKDQIISSEVSAVGAGEASFLLRWIDGNNHMLVQIGGGQANVYFSVAGAQVNQPGMKAHSVADGATVSCEAISGNLTVRVGETVIFSAAIPVALADATKAGLRLAGQGKLLAWRAQSLAAAPEVATPVPTNRDGQLAALLYSTTRTAVASDNFDRADAPIGTPVLGPAWSTAINDSPVIVSNKATLAAPKNDGAYLNSTNGNRWSVRGTLGNVAVGSAEAGVTVWVNGVTGWQILQLRRLVTKISVRRFTGTTYEEIFFQTAVAQTVAERAEIIVLNDAAWFIYDGVLIYTLILPSAPTSYKFPGFLVGHGATLDNWTLDKLVTA